MIKQDVWLKLCAPQTSNDLAWHGQATLHPTARPSLHWSGFKVANQQQKIQYNARLQVCKFVPLREIIFLQDWPRSTQFIGLFSPTYAFEESQQNFIL